MFMGEIPCLMNQGGFAKRGCAHRFHLATTDGCSCQLHSGIEEWDGCRSGWNNVSEEYANPKRQQLSHWPGPRLGVNRARQLTKRRSPT